ncbi:hypothetical protein HYPSUDRAFT_48946 [Hypholoma sublateritium FD-334 SS-4]|uniref:F-box domain-containing protein n=1 Tax=Hypholoma sublateritium (strain FD-334 SS-4) TaxID=945553 RepID=A0A0D2P229_HYPSF|nr:hypothetical protein HYPSUDRAFT_48946 [Hypholoma sublateritium FD-334 SS-4]
MSADRELRTLPSFKLHPPLLWEIFSINAPWETSMMNISDFHPLTVTRRTSQVCRVWRQVLLESPSIWGRCFDFDMFSEKEHDQWRDLVLQRTGQSPLAVMLHRQKMPPGGHLSDYFMKLLDDQWTRIGKVDLSLWFNDIRMWETFARPAASLIFFSVSMFSSRINLPANYQLFSNHAPSLIQLSLPAQQFQLQPNVQQSLMFNSMRHLQLFQGQGLNGIDLLAALQGMPLLEVLEMDITRLGMDNPTATRDSKISMPRLNSVSVWSSSISAFPAFLEQLAHPPCCELYLTYSLLLNHLPNPETTTEYAQSVIKRFLDVSAMNHREVELLMRQDDFITTFGRRVFRLHMKGHLDAVNRVIFVELVDAMADFKNLDTVSELKLDLFQGRDNPPPECLLGLYRLFRVMPSVTKLIATPTSVSMLVDPLPFPLLNILKVESIYAASSSDIGERIIPFIIYRYIMKAPVGTLDLTQNWFPGDYRVLDKLAGLKVVWNHQGSAQGEKAAGEYICGSGDTEKLFLHIRRR